MSVCLCVYMVRFKKNILIAVNSLVCYIWIVNGRTDSNTCLFSVSGFFVLFWNSMCKVVCMCESVCVCVYMITL